MSVSLVMLLVAEDDYRFC